jgi:uncharacterized SAM-binding protein YcdF (DUF218 family)
VLGAPNSAQGQLSHMALDRLRTARQFYQNNPTFKFLCTGGFGPHFNTTNQPHAHYAAQYLMARGVPAANILDYVLSRNTVEDATLVKPMLAQYQPAQVVVVTSDFHMPRAKLLFQQHLPDQHILFVAAVSTLDAATLAALLAHERRALEQLRAQPN